ncbi:hypothetical protein [Streptomyces sp. CBMA152]|uniref:hypothetical protein n=1 Tax=Streptomyces sp. CBMA152 TaxID=1896312 RepID=UPI001660C5AC|nr:hypothetical protein [Streptomyces sp. CBMA152]MBD0745887.1 hypothetical protein [Streptomyces sp. CBMA152]
MTNQRGKALAAAAVAALCALTALPGQGRAQAANGQVEADARGRSSSYHYDPNAQPVTGAASGQGGPRLVAKTVYRSTIGPGATISFQVDLDGSGDAYVSAVAVPKQDAKVSSNDGIQLTLRDRNGNTCDSNSALFGTPQYPRPIAAYVSRGLNRQQTPCQAAGTYTVLIERIGDQAAPWGLELRQFREPRVASGGPSTAPMQGSTASPPAPTGGGREIRGGTGFADAFPMRQGEWRDKLRPGDTLFYRVPVGWDQQLSVTAVLARYGGNKYVPEAIDLRLYNPALGLVGYAFIGYDGSSPASTGFQPLATVNYRNRYANTSSAAAMRFNGDYYLAVSLSPALADALGSGPYVVTLRVDVHGKAGPGPAYEGGAPSFGTTGTGPAQGTVAATSPRRGSGSTRMRLLAAAGIGTGTLLMVGLGVWTLVARRRALSLRSG